MQPIAEFVIKAIFAIRIGYNYAVAAFEVFDLCREHFFALLIPAVTKQKPATKAGFQMTDLEIQKMSISTELAKAVS